MLGIPSDNILLFNLLLMARLRNWKMLQPYIADWSSAFITSDDFIRSNEIFRTKWSNY